ncbi:MAG: glycosyltransferase family 4 protein [Planctomycetes bacterium]|nr:glycosyltransferase family 4 protein [Planctomycetota bacterium]
MPPLRVLRCITRLNVGGPTRHVSLLMNGLDPDRYEQLLVHGSAEREEGEERVSVSGSSIHVPDLVRRIAPLGDRRARRALAALLVEHVPDIVHTHQGKAGALARLEAARAGTRAIVHTYHGHTFDGYFGPLVGAAVRWVERRAARVSHALVCQSTSQERDVLRVLGAAAEGRTRIIAPAIDSETFAGAAARRAPARRALGVGADTRIILLSARLVPIKCPERAVDVIASLTAHTDVVLVIAGDGPLRKAVTARSRARSVEDRVRLLGWRDDLPDLYAAADLVLLTSSMEGTPLCLLEAMAAGAPVAAPDVGGVADLLGDDGVLLDPEGTPADWAASLRPVLEDRDDQRCARARARVLVTHAPARLLRDVEALYSDLTRA